MTDPNIEFTHPSISQELIDKLTNTIIELSSRGEIRKTTDNRYSIYDVIKIVTQKSSQAQVWKQLLAKDNDTIINYDSVKLSRSDGKKGNIPTPVAKLSVILQIIISLPGKFSDKLRNVLSEIGSTMLEQESIPESTAIAPPPIASSEQLVMMSMLTQLNTKIESIATENKSLREAFTTICEEVKENRENKKFVQEVAPGLTETENRVIETKSALPAVVKYFTAPEWLKANQPEFGCVPKLPFCRAVSEHYKVMLQNRPLQQNGKYLYNSTHEYVLRGIAESIKNDRMGIFEHNKLLAMRTIAKLNPSS